MIFGVLLVGERELIFLVLFRAVGAVPHTGSFALRTQRKEPKERVPESLPYGYLALLDLNRD